MVNENPAVNAAWVGVIGAAVGGGIAGVTAIGTSYFQLRLSRAQLKAQKDEANRQRRYESVVERRQPRADAYAAFLEVSTQVIQTIARHITDAKQAGATVRMVPQSTPPLNKESAAVSIAGPRSVAERCDAFTWAFIQLVSVEYVPGPSGNEDLVMSHIVLLNQRINEFTEAARAALEDHGEEPNV